MRRIEIMGEAARRISDNFKALHSSVKWHQITGMRNRLIHEYDAVDLDVVWDVVHHDLPALIRQLESLIANGM